VKILHLEAGRHLYGGARQVQYLIEGLSARGLENVLVCPTGSAIAGALGESARVHAVPLGGDLDLGLILRLRRILRSERPDLVHLHSRRGADIFGGIAARMAAIPCVLSRRVDNPEPPWLARRKYRLYHRVITISEGIRQVLLSEGVEPERVVCVHSAVEAAAYAAPCDRSWLSAELDIPPDAPLAAMVAQLIPRKGHLVLLDALPEVLAAHPDLRMLLFGKGPMRTELHEEIRRRGLGASVRLAGFRPDLHRILCCLDLLVHPALMEGLGVALLQAAAAGVPIVASRAGGIPEAVHDGHNGLLIPAGDSAALASAMRRLLSDEPLRRRMGEAGRRIVASQFSVDSMVEGNLRVYRALLG
jgi:glycosyltransferase involved in cell wall biosynthesis